MITFLIFTNLYFRFNPINEGELNSSQAVNSLDLCTDKHLVELHKRKQEIIMQIERHNMLYRKQLINPTMYDQRQYSQISICKYRFCFLHGCKVHIVSLVILSRLNRLKIIIDVVTCIVELVAKMPPDGIGSRNLLKFMGAFAIVVKHCKEIA